MNFGDDTCRKDLARIRLKMDMIWAEDSWQWGNIIGVAGTLAWCERRSASPSSSTHSTAGGTGSAEHDKSCWENTTSATLAVAASTRIVTAQQRLLNLATCSMWHDWPEDHWSRHTIPLKCSYRYSVASLAFFRDSNHPAHSSLSFFDSSFLLDEHKCIMNPPSPFPPPLLQHERLLTLWSKHLFISKTSTCIPSKAHCKAKRHWRYSLVRCFYAHFVLVERMRSHLSECFCLNLFADANWWSAYSFNG